VSLVAGARALRSPIMKSPVIVALFLSVGLIRAEEPEIDWIQYGTPIDIPASTTEEEPRPKSILDREIEAFLLQFKSYDAARLINNSSGRALDDAGHLVVGGDLGRVVNPSEVIIIAPARVPRSIVELYTAIKKLPNCAESICVYYSSSPDWKTGDLLGYTIENPRGTNTKLVKYDGVTPWLEWITASFKKDGEQAGSGQPATRPESKPEGSDQPQPESEGRTR